MWENNLIYLVDDDDIYRNVITDFLTKINQTVVQFSEGLSFLEQIEQDVKSGVIPDIIFLDLKMPVIDGWEITDRLIDIQSEYKINLNIHIVSTSLSESDINTYKKKYTDSVYYHVKPLNKEGFINIINNNFDLE